MTTKLSQEEVLAIINNDEKTAYGILYDADPKLATRFGRVDRLIVKLLKDVKKHFPDATYYTGSGGFNLLLGESHNDKDEPQSELIACSGLASIGGGDW